MTPNPIIKAEKYLNTLKNECPSIEIPYYMFPEWYSTHESFFFDCEENNLDNCMEEKYTYKKFPYFRVYYIVEDSGDYHIRDISYPNIGNSSISSWIPRYMKNLKPSTLMSLSASGVKHVKELGSSYRT